MGASILIEALGVPIRLDMTGLTDAESAAVGSSWRDAEVDPDRLTLPELLVRVREEGDRTDIARLLEALSQRVTVAAVTARRGELWMLHAAGLALADGRVIVLVGPSGRGKTTASRTLGTHLGYVSDETVAIDASGLVVPYRKPLSIIEGGVYPKVQRAPSSVGLADLPDAPLRLAAVVLLDRRVDGPDHPHLEVVDLGDALEELISQTSFLPDLDRPLAMIAGLLAPLGGVLRIVYREAATLAEVIDDVVAVRPALRWRAVSGDRPLIATSDEGDVGGERRLMRAPVDDAIALHDPDRLAVVRIDDAGDGTVHVVGGIAPTLWCAASDVAPEDLVRAAVAAHGEPEGEDAGELVADAVADLIEAGLLHIR